MTNDKLAHIARLLQELNQNFHDANVYLSKAWGAHTMMRDAIFHLTMAYDAILRETEKQHVH